MLFFHADGLYVLAKLGKLETTLQMLHLALFSSKRVVVTVSASFCQIIHMLSLFMPNFPPLS